MQILKSDSVLSVGTMRTGSPAPGRRRIVDLRATVLICLLIAFPSGVGAAGQKSPSPQGLDLFGWVEWVFIGESKMHLKAKLDTGAETSSLDASEIRILQRRRGGRRMVEFRLSDDDSGRTIVFKKRLVREARIKEHDGSFQNRPVVIVSVCLGDHLQDVEVTLIDRSEFLYPVLLGRSALAGLALVDPNVTFTRDPSCSYPDEDS